MSLPPSVVQHLPPAQPRHIHSGFLQTVVAQATGAKLAFKLGDGPWLEQLVCRLATREGHAVQYFGRNGQAQWGIDLVGTDGPSLSYWQCKNLESAPKPGDITGWVQKMIDEALTDQGLEPPRDLFLCCPNEIKDTPLNAEFIHAHEALNRLGITLHWWGYEHLSNLLKSAPDIVAELFGLNAVLAHCPTAGWKADMWRPIDALEASGPLYRYVNAQRGNALWRPAAAASAQWPTLQTHMLQHRLAFVQGRSGAGKTFAVLDACEHLEGYCAYYLNLDRALASYSPVALADGMAQRNSRDVIFVIDDVHSNPQQLQDVVSRFAAQCPASANSRVVCLAREPLRLESGDWEWLESLDPDAMHRHLLTAPELRDFALTREPAWKGASTEELDTLIENCARNLYLIAEACGLPHLPDLRAGGGRSAILQRTRNLLNIKTADQRALVSLAAIGQFELTVRVASLDAPHLPTIEEFANRTHWLELSPLPNPEVRFSHAAAAELVLHAYFDDGWAASLPDFVVGRLKDYLTWLRSQAQPWLAHLRAVLRQRMAWMSEVDEVAAKLGLLTDPILATVWVEEASEHDPSLISVAFALAHATGHPAEQGLGKAFVAALQRQLGNPPAAERTAAWFGFVNWTLTSLRATHSELWYQAAAAGTVSQWHAWIRQSSLRGFVKLLAALPPDLAGHLIDATSADDVEEMLSVKNLGLGSVAPFIFAMRDFAKLGKGEGSLHARLAYRLGSQTFRSMLGMASLGDYFNLRDVLPIDLAQVVGLGLEDAGFNGLVQRSIERGEAKKVGISLRYYPTALSPDRMVAALTQVCALGAIYHLLKVLTGWRRREIVHGLSALQDVSWATMLERTEPEKRFFEVTELLGQWSAFGFTGHTRATSASKCLEALGMVAIPQSDWYGLASGKRCLRQSFMALGDVANSEIDRRAKALTPGVLHALGPADLDAVRERIWSLPGPLLDAWFQAVAQRLLSSQTSTTDLVRWGPALFFWLHDLRCPAEVRHRCVQYWLGDGLMHFVNAGNWVQSFLALWNLLLVQYEHADDGTLSLREFAQALGRQIAPPAVQGWRAGLAGASAMNWGSVLPFVGTASLMALPLLDLADALSEWRRLRPEAAYKELDRLGGPAGILAQIGAQAAFGDPQAWAPARMSLFERKYSALTLRPRAVLDLLALAREHVRA